MSHKPTTDELLKRDLEDLYRSSVAARDMGRDLNEVQQRIDEVEIRWTEVLEKERGLRIEQARSDTKHVVEQQELDAHRRDRKQQDHAMQDLARRNPRQIIFHATESREVISPEFEDQRNRAAAALFEPIESQINDRYKRLRTGLELAVDAISEGGTPDLRFLIEQQLDWEAKLEKAIENVQQRSREEEREN